MDRKENLSLEKSALKEGLPFVVQFDRTGCCGVRNTNERSSDGWEQVDWDGQGIGRPVSRGGKQNSIIDMQRKLSAILRHVSFHSHCIPLLESTSLTH